MTDLTPQERTAIEEILDRRANEIAKFKGDYCNNPSHFGSVELALSREIGRLRELSARVMGAEPEEPHCYQISQ